LSAAGGHDYLPDAAMGVIADYLVVAELQQHPKLASSLIGDDDDSADSDPAHGATDGSTGAAVSDGTNGSHTPLPGFESPSALPPAPPPGEGYPARLRRRGVAAWFTGRALLPLWARLLIAVLLVGSGAAIGLALRAPDRPADPAASASKTPAVSHTAAVSAANTTPSPSAPPSSSPPPAASGAPPSLCSGQATSRTPELCASQPYGDGDTVFVVHGSGFRPFETITVSLAMAGGTLRASSEHPVVDLQGTFNYAVDQGHLFFSGAMPAGDYRVVATEAGGLSASVTFQVNSAASGGPPPPPQ
jgi:hypothetical protein